MNRLLKISIIVFIILPSAFSQINQYPIVDTDVILFYNNNTEIPEPSAGDRFYGQDAHYEINSPSYRNHSDSIILDEVTGLMWQKYMGDVISWEDAMEEVEMVTTGGYTDWRMPTIKELYSLILYSGRCFGPDAVTLFIDTAFFDQPLGDVSVPGGREIDAQTWSSTEYLGNTFINDDAVFGVNFVDGRVKGYPKVKGSGETLLRYARYVRGNPEYGKNNFKENKDGTISDLATGLMWQQVDNGETYDWEGALDYAEDLELAGHSDWRLPNAKELQSIVDYSRSPHAEGGSSAAIDPIFEISQITDPEGEAFYPYFWTSTTLLDGPDPGNAAVYIPFGRALGYVMIGPNEMLLDVHGAGAVRSDPKTGDPDDYPRHDSGFQGDLQYVFNHVRCVRNTDGTTQVEDQTDLRAIIHPNPVIDICRIQFESTQNNVHIDLIDLSGRPIQSIHAKNKKDVPLILTSIPAGPYFARILADGKTGEFRIIKAR